ncbi:MAG: AMP-binding protein [Pseudomonadota bacterium]
MEIGGLLTRNARYRPAHLGFAFEEDRFTYREFNALVNGYANGLLKAGLHKGDCFATLLPNSTELMALYWAAAKTGCVIVPLSTLLQEAGLKGLLVDSGSRLIFAEEAFAEPLGRLLPDLPVVLHRQQSQQDFLVGAPITEPPDPGLGGQDIFNIMYTSGTTGAPKGIVHDHFVRAAYCTIFATAFRMTPESVVLHAGSIVFNGAMIDLMPWMFVGCTYLLHEKFDPAAVIATIDREKVTHIVLVPAQIIAILNHPDFAPDKLASLEMILSVGAPLHLDHKKRLNQVLPERFYELYGLTEGFATVLDCKDALRKEGSVGVPLPFSEIAIRDDAGRDLPAGEVGEICGKSPFLMPGYHKRPDLSAQAIVDGWLKTGDAGYLDDDGYLYLVDRIKDMLVSGGVNVYPKDIEEIIIQHPEVAEVAVFGVPHETWGETPVATVIAKDGSAIDEATLIEWTNARVGAKYQRISGVMVLDSFPRNIAGKTLKHELRARYGETS